MLSRSSAVIVSLTSLSAGIVLGILLGRGGPVVSAQVAGDGLAANWRHQRPGSLAKSDSPESRRRRDLRRPGETVRAVPAGQPDVRAGRQGGFAVGGSHRRAEDHATRGKPTVRQFEETGSGVIIRSDQPRAFSS